MPDPGPEPALPSVVPLAAPAAVPRAVPDAVVAAVPLGGGVGAPPTSRRAALAAERAAALAAEQAAALAAEQAVSPPAAPPELHPLLRPASVPPGRPAPFPTVLPAPPVRRRDLRAGERAGERAGDPRMGAPRPTVHRADVEGLRGVSVLLVVAFHAGLAALPGGFVGVDVFFVISGFLITGLLVDELEARGTISLRRFYARRVRRLLPMACLVLAATALVFGAVLAPLDRPGLGGDVAAAALWTVNWRFAAAATDYMNGVDASAVLHYWSLSVEEQFYVVWPLVVLLAAASGRRGPGALRRRLATVFAVLAAGSLAASVLTTAGSGPWAYFGLHTRGWELAAGGLLALARTRLARTPGLLRGVAGWLGLGLIAFAALRLGRDTPFPGTAALWPVAGAALVLAAGIPAGGPARGRAGTAAVRGGVAGVLGVGPLAYLGQISYAWYLWHWPCLVLVQQQFGEVSAADDGAAPSVGPAYLLVAVAGSLLLAVVSHHVVEQPVRTARPLVRAPGLTLGLGAATVAAAIAVAALGPGLPLGGPEHVEVAAASSLEPLLPDAPTPGATALGSSASGSSVPGPSASGASAAGASGAGPSPSGYPPPGPRTPRMTPAQARADDTAPDRCFLGFAAVTVDPTCRIGGNAGDGGPVVVLFGDSHAAHWYPALARAANAQGWTLWFWAKSGCGYADVPQWITTFDRYYTECATWRSAVLNRIAALPRVDAVLVGRTFAQFSKVTDAAGTKAAPDRAAAAWSAGAARTFTALRGDGGRTRVVLLRDTPRPVTDAPACLSAHPTDPDACDYPREGHVGLDADVFAAEKGPLAASGGVALDLGDLVCSTDPCPVVSTSGAIMFRDEHHLTATFARELAPGVVIRLRPYLAA